MALPSHTVKQISPGAPDTRTTPRGTDSLDRIDRKILFELQRNANIPIAQLAERVGLSQTPCWKRVQKLEQAGVILGRVALVNPQKIGLGLMVFVEVTALDHSPAWRDRFAEVASSLPEVVDVFRMAGEVDYLLRVVVEDMARFDKFYKHLTSEIGLKTVTSKFTMETIKTTTVFPINTLDR
jgi:Lrp/AsnC family transcriptional regulator